MHGVFDRAGPVSAAVNGGAVHIASRSEVSVLPHWRSAFAAERKDRRYYELLEDTLTDQFKYGYLVVRNGMNVCAVQPYFILDQDLAAGSSGRVNKWTAGIRRLWPRFMR